MNTSRQKSDATRSSGDAAPGRGQRSARARRRPSRRVLAAGSVLLLAGSYLLTVLHPVSAADSGLHEVGVLKAPLADTRATFVDGAAPLVPPPMIVDQTHDLGFAIGWVADPDVPGLQDVFLGMYDLKGLGEIARIPWPASSVDIYSFAIDEVNEQLYAPAAQGDLAAGVTPCAGTHPANVIRYGSDPGGKRALTQAEQPLPCSGSNLIVPQSVSFYNDPDRARHDDKMYVTGSYGLDQARGLGSAATRAPNNLGASMLVQQLDLATLVGPDPENAVDWEVDLQSAGCGRRDVFLAQRVTDPARSLDAVLSYCQDTQLGPTTATGWTGGRSS